MEENAGATEAPAVRKSPRLVSRNTEDPPAGKSSRKKSSSKARKSKRRVHLQKVEYNDAVFSVGDDVYVRKLEASEEREESDEEIEECKVCGKAGGETMLECDACLGGFHLSCLNPPLEAVPEGDWVCSTCAKSEKDAESKPEEERTDEGKTRHRTAREKLLNKELWAARIERLWEEDGKKWFSGFWYVIPEETSTGRQPHNGRRELFRTNHVDQNELDSILRHCFVLTPDEYSQASNEGDDVFFCEYEYDVKRHVFKRIVDLEEDNKEINEEEMSEEENKEDGQAEEPKEGKENVTRKRRRSVTPSGTPKKKAHTEITGLESLQTEKAVKDSRPLTEIEKAKAALALSAAPDALPCREKERSEIESFVMDAIKNGVECLGKCLYISGVPGTGKTATVLDVMKSMEAKLNAKEVQPYRFLELNGLRLTSPEQTYTVLHEALTGQRLGWKRSLQLLDERFSDNKSSKTADERPCVLLVDELDVLVTRSQSVLYNIFDWPCRPHSRLVVIGIANTIDLPERLLPRIASRMGLQRVSFSPYTHGQLQEIISYRLTGIEAFEKSAVEFASRKVAAVSGDARRALELCRRAAEIAESRQGEENLQEEPNVKLIGMADVEAAVHEMFQAPHVQVMRRCSKQAKIFLVAMVYEYLKTGMAEATFEQVSRAHALLCSNNNESVPSKDTLLLISCRLGQSRLVLCEPGSKRRLQKLQLNFPSDDVIFALKDTPELPWISKYLC